MDIERVIDIAAPQERVWGVMSDVERWPEWTASVTSVELLDQGPMRVGSRVRNRQPRLPAAVWTVTRFEPEYSFQWQNAAPGLRSVASHRVDSVGDHASRATLSIAWSGPLAPVFRRLFGNLSRRYVEMEAEGLKQRSEASEGMSTNS